MLDALPLPAGIAHRALAFWADDVRITTRRRVFTRRRHQPLYAGLECGMSLRISSRVRYIGGQREYRNPLLLALIGHTGTIRSRSTHPDGDWWDVEMDEGVIDLDAKESALVPIDDLPDAQTEHGRVIPKRSAIKSNRAYVPDWSGA